MNALSRKLSSRTMSGPDPHAHRTLADLGRGDRAIIAGVRTDIAPDVARRLFDLGFTPGSEVALLRRSPLADPAIYRVADYDIALRRREARLISITTVPCTESVTATRTESA